MHESDFITVILDAKCEAPNVRAGALQGVYSDGVVRELAAKETPHLGRQFLQAAFRFANQPALITASHEYSYEEVACAAAQVAGHLTMQPTFAAGDRVILVAENSIEYLAGFYGILLAGGVVVPLPSSIDRSRLKNVVHRCDARLVLADVATARRQDASATDNADCIRLAIDHCGGSESINVSERLCPTVKSYAGGDSLAMVLFTSGSTGNPKGVMLSHRNLLANATSIQSSLPIRATDRALTVIPFCHAYGNSVVQTHMFSGAALVVDGSPIFPNTIVEAMDRHQATSFAGVPELYHSLLACSELGTRSLGSLRYMTVAGGAMRPEAASRVAEQIAPAELYIMYGQTEATARLAYLSPGDLKRRPGSIGKAIPGVELQVQDDQGRPVASGERGELCARGANVMLGYWNDQAATAETIVDGWLRTGDVACVDDDGYISLSGRRNHEVKIRGVRIDLDAIAGVLTKELSGGQFVAVAFESNSIRRVALFAKCDATGSTVVTIRRVCRTLLSEYEMPCYIECVEAFPLNDVLKIDRQKLADRASSRFEATAAREPALCGEVAT